MSESEIPEVEMTQEQFEAATQQAKQEALQDAQRLVAQEKQQRAQACGRAIQDVLRRFHCELRAMPHIQDGRVEARPLIMPLDLQTIEGHQT